MEEELEKQEDTLHSDLEEDLEEDSLNSSGEQEEEEEENGYDETFERDQQESKKAQIISELNSDNDGGPPTKRVKFSCPLVSEGTIVSRKLQGLMNKLNESNLLTIFKSIEDLYKNNSQNGKLTYIFYACICVLFRECVHVVCGYIVLCKCQWNLYMYKTELFNIFLSL